MSYDLYMTRADHWSDADQHPITRAEWESFAEAHPKLSQDGEVGWADIGTQPVYSFTCEDDGEVCLSWRHDCVEVWGELVAHEAVIAAVAGQLSARLFGEEGEEYFPDGSVVR